MVHRPGAAHDVHAEKRFQLAAELSRRVLLHMPDVPDRSGLPVRSGDDERSAARKDALEFPQHRGDLGDMLDHIRQNDEGKLCIAEWNEACRYVTELQISQSGSRRHAVGLPNSALLIVNTGDVGARIALGDEIRKVAVATPDIQDPGRSRRNATKHTAIPSDQRSIVPPVQRAALGPVVGPVVTYLSNVACIRSPGCWWAGAELLPTTQRPISVTSL